MKILFAAADRDLLECYQQLLAGCGEIVTAFDGTQVLSLISAEHFDVAILDSVVPRVDHKTLVVKIREKHLPVVVLTEEKVSARRLAEEALPNAYLSYPFHSETLIAVIQNVLETASSDQRLTVGDVEVVLSDFRIAGGAGLTLDEIKVLRSLSEGKAVTTCDGACVSALNEKLAAVGSATRIRYRTKKGFEPVTSDE